MCHLMSFYVATALSSHGKKNPFLYVYYSNRLNARLTVCLVQASSWLSFTEAQIR